MVFHETRIAFQSGREFDHFYEATLERNKKNNLLKIPSNLKRD